MHIFRHNVPFTALGGSIQMLVSKLVSKAGIHVAEDKPIGMHSFCHPYVKPTTKIKEGPQPTYYDGN